MWPSSCAGLPEQAIKYIAGAGPKQSRTVRAGNLMPFGQPRTSLLYDSTTPPSQPQRTPEPPPKKLINESSDLDVIAPWLLMTMPPPT